MSDNVPQTNNKPSATEKALDLFRFLKDRGTPMRANDSVVDRVSEEELENMVVALEDQFKTILNTMLIDFENDSNSKETPRRLAKMYVNELMVGRYRTDIKLGTVFPNEMQLDQVYVVGPIEIKSMCSHHWAPIVGEAYVAIKPGTTVLGLSKFHRRINALCRRPQIQEELTQQVLKDLVEAVSPLGAMVFINAKHMCCSHRGANAPLSSSMATSALHGEFRTDASLKSEALNLISLMKNPTL